MNSVEAKNIYDLRSESIGPETGVYEGEIEWYMMVAIGFHEKPFGYLGIGKIL